MADPINQDNSNQRQMKTVLLAVHACQRSRWTLSTRINTKMTGKFCSNKETIMRLKEDGFFKKLKVALID